MVDGFVAAVGSDCDDLGLAGCSSLCVLDAVSLGWVVGAEFSRSNQDAEVGGLVKAFRFLGIDAKDYSFHWDWCVASCYLAGGWVISAGGGGFDVREVLAPLRHQCFGDRGKYVVD